MQHKFDGELATPQPAVEAAPDSNKRGMKGAVLQSYTGSSSTQLRKDMRSGGNIVSQSFSVQQEILEDGAGGKAVMQAQSFGLAGSFIAPASDRKRPGEEDDGAEKKAILKEIMADPTYKTNLIASAAIQSLSAFNFYLITFDLKSFPGNIYVNSLCYAAADLTAYICSGLLLKYASVTKGFIASGTVTMVASVVFIFVVAGGGYESLSPVVISFARVGCCMSFNIGYVAVAKLFPTGYVASVFGIVNFMSHIVTIGAPLVAELPSPIPFCVIAVLAGASVVFARRLEELR